MLLNEEEAIWQIFLVFFIPSRVTKEKMKKENSRSAVIIAKGRFPQHPIPLSYINSAEYIVCCDGAANEFIAGGGIPNAIVGDGDSVSTENRQRFGGILHINRDQETNDLTKSVHYCVQRGITDIVIVGGTGRREDHTLGNISLLAEYIAIDEITRVIMTTDWGIFTPIRANQVFQSFKGEAVSLFSLDREPITTRNLKYALDNRVLTNWWQGSLNVSLGDTFTVKTSGRVIVFQAYK